MESRLRAPEPASTAIADHRAARPAPHVSNQLMVRLLAAHAGRHATDEGLADRIRARLGAGEPLAGGLRADLEGGLDQPLGAVRIHRDAAAAGLSRELHAHAFTTGNDVFFGSGSYDPGSNRGFEMIAHEMTHTLQQGPSGPSPGGGLRVS